MEIEEAKAKVSVADVIRHYRPEAKLPPGDVGSMLSPIRQKLLREVLSWNLKEKSLVSFR